MKIAYSRLETRNKIIYLRQEEISLETVTEHRISENEHSLKIMSFN